MGTHPVRVTLPVCPLSRRQHAVRVDADPDQVAYGAWAVARRTDGSAEARV